MPELDDQTIELAATGRLEDLKTRLEKDPGLAHRTNAGGETLLHIAARQWPKLANGAKIARVLLDAGADVNAGDRDGMRPITGATGDIELTRALLEAGAKTAIYSEGHMNMSPAEVCLYYGLTDEARLLVDHGASVDLRVAAGIGDADRVRGYLDDSGAFRDDCVGLPGQPGPKPSVADGVTQALSYAARNGQAEIVELLLDHGADIDALVPDFDVGCTPLHQAVSGGHLHIAKILVARGARVDIRDDSHRATPREWAEHQGKSDLVRFLAEHGG